MMRKPHSQFFEMKCVIVLLALVTSQLGQSVGQDKLAGSRPPARSVASEVIGSDAIWELTSDFLKRVHSNCDHKANEKRDDCFIDQMARAGAPPAATRFSRRLLLENGGEFGVMMRFKKIGPVDMAKVLYPFRKDQNWALLLVNGNSPILDVDDLSKLDMTGIQLDAGYRAMKRAHPNLQIWGGPRGGSMWETVRKQPNGGLSFDIYYMLNPERPNGRWMSGANFDWNFDATGRFLGTEFTGGVGPLPI
jgi:hypothetical protein